MEKKDGGKHMVIDYHRLNKQTVKNNYPLPLITNLVDSMGNKKLFTKMDLQWDYNNVRIKEGNEWKVAFTTHCNKMADELGHPRRWIILFLFHFLLLCNSLKYAGHYDSKGVCRII